MTELKNYKREECQRLVEILQQTEVKLAAARGMLQMALQISYHDGGRPLYVLIADDIYRKFPIIQKQLLEQPEPTVE